MTLIRSCDATSDAPLSRIRLTASQAHVLIMASTAESSDKKMPIARITSAVDSLTDFGLVEQGNYPTSRPRSMRGKPWIRITDRGFKLVKNHNAGRPRSGR